MELRRPTLEDKETILEMMAEFEQTQSASTVGVFGMLRILFMKSGLEENLQAEVGLKIA